MAGQCLQHALTPDHRGQAVGAACMTAIQPKAWGHGAITADGNRCIAACGGGASATDRAVAKLPLYALYSYAIFRTGFCP